MADLELEHNLQNALRENDEDLHGNAHKRKRDMESADSTGRVHKRLSPNHSGMKSNELHQQDSVEALQDYQPLHHQHHDQNGAEHASSTAAAALAGIFPTMTIPQPTDVSFATQGSDDRNPDNSFMDNSQQGDNSFLDGTTPSRSSTSKPAVGSEEWHKVRKDNHKEGTLARLVL